VKALENKTKNINETTTDEADPAAALDARDARDAI
jgi:hypothetical protein